MVSFEYGEAIQREVFRLVSFLFSYDAFDIAYRSCMQDVCQPRSL